MRSALRPTIAAAVLAACLLVPAGGPAHAADTRVIAGTDVSSATHPYQVRLSIRFGASTYQCGGVIRDATHVMTAAHCVVSSGSVASAGNVTVHYGNAGRSRQAAASVYSVLPAPQYLAGDRSSDAALLTLAAPLAGYGSASVRPVALASAAQVASAVSAGSPAIVTGWGLSEQGSVTQGLRAATLSLRPDSACRNVYGRTYVSSRLVCAGGTGAPGTVGNPDSCSGDSGGPLVVSQPGGYALVGLVSFGPAGGCGRGGLPGAYTEVSNPEIHALLTGRTVPAPPPVPVPVPAAAVPAVARPDVTPPRASVAGLRCRRRTCTVRLSAADNRGPVPSVLAITSRKVQVCSARRKGRRSCRQARRTRRLALKRIPGGFRGSFRLAPGSYRFSAAVIDAAGNRSRAIGVAFRVRR